MFKLTFLPVTRHHKAMILKWLEAPHVAEFFYGDGLKNTLRNLDLSCDGVNHNGAYAFYHWVAYHDETPFAFIMTSPVEGPYDPEDAYNQWYEAGARVSTLDLLIGEPDFLGKGLASQMIQTFIRQQYSDIYYFLIDPEAGNTKAIHVYEKAGFRKIGEIVPPFNPKPHVMMRLDVNQLRIDDELGEI